MKLASPFRQIRRRSDLAPDPCGVGRLHDLDPQGRGGGALQI